MPMIFKGFNSEKRGEGRGRWRGGNKIRRKHKGWITKYTEISFAKRLLPAAIISKALRCAGFKARGRVEAFRDGFLKTNISSYSH